MNLEQDALNLLDYRRTGYWRIAQAFTKHKGAQYNASILPINDMQYTKGHLLLQVTFAPVFMCNHTSEQTDEDIVLCGRVAVEAGRAPSFEYICQGMIAKQIDVGNRMYARMAEVRGAGEEGDVASENEWREDADFSTGNRLGVSLKDSMQAPTSHREVKTDRKRTLEVASQASESKKSTVKTPDLLPTSSQQDAETKTKASKKKKESMLKVTYGELSDTSVNANKDK